jgi:hypothetical protein
MASTMNYSFRVVSPAAVFDNAFASDKFTYIDCNSAPQANAGSQRQGTNFLGNLQTLRIQGTANYPTLQPSQYTGIVVSGYRDEAGTELILEPTAGQIYPDITGGKHSGSFSLDLIINLAPADRLYLFIKTIHIKEDGSYHAGDEDDTFSVSELEVTCRRN